MNVGAHYKSLTRELEALKDRVRNFDHTTGWLAEGEWKESVLRSILRRYLPAGIEPLRGYVVTARESSKQIDVILYDSRTPVLFRDGDLIFVTPDAVRGIIEVKTRVDNKSELREALTPLAENAAFVRRNFEGREIFVGLFAYDSKLSELEAQNLLDVLASVADGSLHRRVTCACLGCSLLCLLEHLDVPGDSYETWRSYWAQDQAAGHFIVNAIKTVAPGSILRNQDIWFPSEGTDMHRLADLRFVPHNTADQADG